MTAEREALAQRVRAALPPDRPVREVSMFGGLSFMVEDSMVVAAGRDGRLLVRIDPTRHDELLGLPGAEPAVMGADRPMGPGWIRVASEGLGTDEQLAFWVDVGLDHRAGP
jgi:TfoX/Sxy family transcriptional regulator of competence genes